VKGDFEVSLNFEILKEPEPADSGRYGTALTVLVNLQKPQWTAAGCYRGAKADENTQFSVWTAQEGNTRDRQFPTRAKTGRIRLVRTGSRIAFCVAEGAGKDYRLLEETAFSDEEVDRIRITACTGGPRAEIDVRITDLRIRTGSRVDRSAVRQAGSAWEFLGVAELFCLGLLVLGLIALGVWLVRRRGRLAEPLAGSSGSATAPVSFSCSTCGKNLKARSALAGKKVRCPQCRKAALVPESPTIAMGGLSSHAGEVPE
jgi:DNA-directed RNA polymerase subunit RPC12/RpoP